MAAPLDTEIAVYALSKGKGVPERAREALASARGLMIQWRAEGRVLDIVDTRIGFEGERRLCARFATGADAADAMKELAALGKGVDLFNVKVEPCVLKPYTPAGRA
jgi:hypothetical protein